MTKTGKIKKTSKIKPFYMKKTGKKKINPLVKYTNTLRCREFVISWSDLITALNLPQEHIVDIYDEYPNVHIVTDTTIVEKNVK